MAENSKIEWTDATFNPWWGCTKVGPGCDNCYAERDANRFSPGHWGAGTPKRLFGEKHWNEPLRWARRLPAKLGRRPRVFCASMADVFDKDAPPGERDRLFRLIRDTPELDWLLLTKRIGNVPHMLPNDWEFGPYRNVWLGATVVNQEEADRDIPKLLEVPARVRFLSIEPMLGPIDLRALLQRCPVHDFDGGFCVQDCGNWRRIDWVIAGGESGPKARPIHPDWVRSIRDQCAAADVAFLFKQHGEWLMFSADSPCIRFDGVHRFARVDGIEYRGSRVVDIGADVAVRVGRKVAGRMIDGRTHSEFPS